MSAPVVGRMFRLILLTGQEKIREHRFGVPALAGGMHELAAPVEVLGPGLPSPAKAGTPNWGQKKKKRVEGEPAIAGGSDRGAWSYEPVSTRLKHKSLTQHKE